MAQFDIYQGPDTGGCDLLLDLQDNLLAELSTRVVAPLISVDTVGPPIRTLYPQLTFNGTRYFLLTHLLAAIPVKALGTPLGNAGLQREEIIVSIDLLFTGI